MRIVFMGSPEFAIPSLQAIFNEYNIVGVVTQPDRPAGRGRELHASAVKVWSDTHGLPIIQPERIKHYEAISQIRIWDPHMIIVAAYGQILPPEILDLPPHGCLNVHASLLPRWRGAAPVQSAILHGDHKTGITIMHMDVGMDTGPILSQHRISILPEETGGELTIRLARLGSEHLIVSLSSYLRGGLKPIPQDETNATFAPMLKKADGALDFKLPANLLERQVRAYEPWPGSFIRWSNRRYVIRKAHSLLEGIGPPGLVIELNHHPAIFTSEGLLVIEIIQPSGRNSMPGDAFLRGAQKIIGDNLSSPS